MVTLKKALADFDLHSKEISDQQTIIKDNIYANFSQLQQIIDIRKTELINQLDKMNLAHEREQIEILLAQLLSCLHFVRKSLRPDDEENVLMMKANTVEQARELTTSFQKIVLMPSVKADIIFSASADVTAVCQNYGEVHTFVPGSNEITYQHKPITKGKHDEAENQHVRPVEQ